MSQATLEPLTPQDSTPMNLQAHLTELRQRLIIVVGTILLALLAGFWAAHPVIRLLKHLAPTPIIFVQLSPEEVLLASFKLAVFIALVIASPVILYQALRFVMPGLTSREKRLAFYVVLGGSLLFALGVWFAYAMVIPLSLQFLLGYGQDLAANQISIGRFIDFCVTLLVLVGAMFELPVVLFSVSLTGLIHSDALLAHWREVIVGIFLASAILTPSQDPFTLVVVSIAMLALYGLSVIPIRLMGH